MSATPREILCAIRENPLDHRLHHMYADSLDYEGQEVRASFVRQKLEDSAHHCPEEPKGEYWLAAYLLLTELPSSEEQTVLMRHRDSRSFFRAKFVCVYARWVSLPCQAWLEYAARILFNDSLVRVELSDRSPDATCDRPCRYLWYSARERSLTESSLRDANDAAVLPLELFRLLASSNQIERGIAVFDSEWEAIGALSDACVTWARRQQPGFPP